MPRKIKLVTAAGKVGELSGAEPESQAASKSRPLSTAAKDDSPGVRSWETSTWWTLSTALYLLPSYPGALSGGPANISAAKLSPTNSQP